MKIQAFIFITSILLLISFVHESEQFGGSIKIPPPRGKRQLNSKVCGIKRSLIVFCTYLGVSQGFRAIDKGPMARRPIGPLPFKIMYAFYLLVPVRRLLSSTAGLYQVNG